MAKGISSLRPDLHRAHVKLDSLPVQSVVIDIAQRAQTVNVVHRPSRAPGGEEQGGES